MKSELLKLDEVSRRQFMTTAAKTAFGVTLFPALSAKMQAAEKMVTGPGTPGFGKAKHVIYLWMSGGMSHIDTFDPKTGSTKGYSNPVRAKAEGIDFLGGYLPKLAENANKLTIIRSMTSKTGVHDSGTYIMKTGYEPRGTIVHPLMGVWASHFHGRIKGVTLPDSVVVNSGSAYPGAGFFPPSMAPIPISNPEAGLQNIRPTTSDTMFSKRVTLMNEFDSAFRKRFDTEDVKSYNEFYDETMKIMKSEDLKAFDLNMESADTREKYGRNSFGQGCLLARRLVESGVRFVEVRMGGWDMHNLVDTSMQRNGDTLDTAFSALLLDLEAKGLLDSTLVVLGSEFGRTPDINENEGRDHYPLAYSTVLAGGGVKRGFAYGASDKDGRRPADKQTTPQDFLATVGHAMGMPVNEVVMSPSNRPFTVADKGVPAIEVFA